ncbi:LysR family transcriptional regulator substrate-binding protein [Gordonia sp. AC31]|uniref:LysR family transcriptional regulator substrate-binding protein n=1 Tax=Gordonia sp. AC31 TaxID=2962571 RepID=UPI0028816AB4|nr:LysR family transcriptional regulator substrate-binding protein [Gordonia sp. AC31]MDT0223343.1 LysR family transcriptional regulator substrate-binding protein [Gordonia sp. AC31]
MAARPRATSPRRPRGRTVDLASLRDRSLICLPRGAGIRSVFDAAASVAGGAIRPAIEASSPDAIIELVCSGMGVGILSESIAAADDRVVAVPIRDVDATAHLGLLWRSGNSAAAARFVEIARDAFAVGD